LINVTAPRDRLGARHVWFARSWARKRESHLLAAVLLLGLVFSVTNDNFLTTENLANIAVQSSMILLISFGMTVVIVSGGIDLSVGAIASIVSVVAVWIFTNTGIPVPVAMLFSLGAGAAIGLLNGVVISYAKVPDFIATLASLTALRGAAYLISGGFTIHSDNSDLAVLANSEVGGIPIPVLITFGVFLVTWLLLGQTPLGRSFYGVGGNRQAARLAGLPVLRLAIAAYVISGVTAAIAGLVAASRTGSGSPIIGNGWELQAIAIVMVGGANLFGGAGSVVGSLFAGYLIGEINNWLSLQAYQDYVVEIVQGTILVGVVFLSQRQWHARARRQRHAAKVEATAHT
jgi:ribose transport system permease protein